MPFPSPTNSATLIGKLTRDPELRTVSTSAGERSVLTLGIAVRKSIKTDQDDTPTADFFDVTVWGPLAETCAAHLTKGRLVGVSARLEPTAWETADGAKRRGMEVIAGAVEFLDRPRRGLLRATVAGRGCRRVALPAACPPFAGRARGLFRLRAAYRSRIGHRSCQNFARDHMR